MRTPRIGFTLNPRYSHLFSNISFIQLFTVTFLLILSVGCKKGDLPDEEKEWTDEQLESIPPPTYLQFQKAYEIITADSPHLQNDIPALKRQMLLWLKDRPNGEILRTVNLQGINSWFDLALRMTTEEWKVALLNIVGAYNSIRSSGDAEQAAAENYSCDLGSPDHSKLNAIQHSYWSAIMAKRSGIEFAKRFSTAHESKSPKDSLFTKMDLHNNLFGIKTFEKNPFATDEQLLQILINSKFVFVKDNDPFPQDALMYIISKREYDGSLNGIMTNPDSGGPWNITFDLNQCDDLVRGQFTIIRGNEQQKRRFSGSLTNGTITFNVSNPYLYENPNNLTFCENISIVLKGNASKLNGSWYSSNCTKGGSIDISK